MRECFEIWRLSKCAVDKGKSELRAVKLRKVVRERECCDSIYRWISVRRRLMGRR